jgi:LSU ribosomal protein L20P
MSYSQLTGQLRKADIQLNRKMLANLAMLDPEAFAKVVETAKQA